jgi:uncharacterized protein (TIGR02145 family)
MVVFILFFIVSVALAFGESGFEVDHYVVTDTRDNKRYPAVKIGNHIWMAQNINYRAGNSWCYNDDKSNCDKYGRLYDWKTAASRACPGGWHLPTNAEWDELTKMLGYDNAGRRLKSSNFWNGIDDFSFSALPGGNRFYERFLHVGSSGNWWTATECGNGKAYYRHMGSGFDNVLEYCNDKVLHGFSVRCIKD